MRWHCLSLQPCMGTGARQLEIAPLSWRQQDETLPELTEHTVSLFGCLCLVPSPGTVSISHPGAFPGAQGSIPNVPLLLCHGLPVTVPNGTRAAHSLSRGTQGTEDGDTSPAFCSDGGALLTLFTKADKKNSPSPGLHASATEICSWSKGTNLPELIGTLQTCKSDREWGNMGKHMASAVQN